MTLTYRTEDIRSHFKHGDDDLAYSTFLDAVLESENIDFFQEVIKNELWREEQNSHNPDLWKQKCLAIVDRLELIQLKERPQHDFLLRCENLQKSYNRGNFKLGPISFNIQRGQLIGLVGENGNGKTTLLRILAKEIAFDQGDLRYANENSFDNNFDHRTKLTYIPQRTPKWYGKIRTNLQFCAMHYGISGLKNNLLVEMMLIRFGLFKYRNSSWSELSSGYKMRFELARTFLRRPEILLLDEPLANLDVFAQQVILNDLKSLAKSAYNPIGIILSSQQLFEVEKVADEVIFLKNGVPKLLENENQVGRKQCVVELETSAERTQIVRAIESLQDAQVHFNGGMYVIVSETIAHANELLHLLLIAKIPVHYFRDISESSKRFFIQ
jgi:ABC-2 type transport system ATP-binding protein